MYKAEEQKLELLRAHIRNAELKQRYNSLENECDTLTSRINSVQLERAESEENSIKMRKELAQLKRLNQRKTNELQLAKSAITVMSTDLLDTSSSMHSFLNQESSIKTAIDNKDEMIFSLQDKLVNTRLKNAENEILIDDLLHVEMLLKNEIKIIKEQKPDTIFLLQEELMDGKMRQVDVQEQFSALKRELLSLKQETTDHFVKESCGGKSGDNLTVTNKLAFWESATKTKKQEKSTNFTVFEEEIKNLNKAVKLLKSQMELINKQRDYKQQEQRQLDVILNKAHARNVNNENLLQKRIEQTENMEQQFEEKMTQIGNNIEEKEKLIEKYKTKIQLLDNDGPNVPSCVRSINEEMIQMLESKIKHLEEQLMDNENC